MTIRTWINALSLYLHHKTYDWKYGVDTVGVIPLHALTLTNTDDTHLKLGLGYEPAYPADIREMLAHTNVDFSRYVFIDIGSGKGRALLVAAEYPFKRITGVEFARELHDAAVLNIRSYRNRAQKCRDVQSIHADATTYDYPPDPLVIFLNNPFRGELMEMTAQRIRRSLDENPRDVFFLCGRWQSTEELSRLMNLTLIVKHHSYKVFRWSGNVSDSR